MYIYIQHFTFLGYGYPLLNIIHSQVLITLINEYQLKTDLAIRGNSNFDVLQIRSDNRIIMHLSEETHSPK